MEKLKAVRLCHKDLVLGAEIYPANPDTVSLLRRRGRGKTLNGT